jgi:hypothetical protein
MNPAANLWVTESNRTTQTLVAAAGVVLGLVLTIGSRSAGEWATGTIAAFVLGLGLSLAGLGMLLFSPKQTIAVNSSTRRITIESRHRFGASSKQLRFDEIADAYVDEVGDKEGGSISFHIVVKLKTGETVPLFAGFFDGGYDRSATEARLQRLMRFVQGTDQAITPPDAAR